MTPVFLFAKPPVPGKVKTRLIPALDADGAAQLAAAMLVDTWRTVERSDSLHPILATTGPGEFSVAVPPADVWLQGEGDLGARLERIFLRALPAAPAAIAIGADSPALTADHLEAALDRLASHDAVIGPSADGGFYLLALKRCVPGLFAALPWSTPETANAMMRRLAEHGYSLAEIEPLWDVDTPADLPVLDRFLRAHPTACPATQTWSRATRPCASASSSRP